MAQETSTERLAEKTPEASFLLKTPAVNPRVSQAACS
jgi:hypothetical protein